MIEMSVIVPTFNRQEKLEVCLEALAAQDLASDRFEVIVVNDGGRLDTAGLRERFGSRMSLVLREQENQGPASARNLGLATAQGRFVAFTDDDCAPDRRWLEAFLQILLREPDQLCGGHTVNALADNLCSATSQLLVDYNYRYFNTDMGPDSYFTSNNMAMSLTRLKEINGFDESFPGACGEDRDLCDRWQDAGQSLRFVPRAVVNHRHDLNVVRLIRQHMNYGKGSWYYHRFRKARKNAELKIEPYGYYRQMFAFAWQAHQNRRLAMIALIIVCQASNAMGYYARKARAVFE